jgi:hypothetical protein
MIEEAQARGTDYVFEKTLRTKANVDPNNLATVLDLVAIGITNGTWRNSCVEDWHAEGRLSDGDMTRTNSHTTDAIRRRLARWTTEFGIKSASSAALAEVNVEDVDVIAIRLFRWMTNPKRKLSIGVTLGELARTAEDVKEYEEHPDRSFSGFVGQMEGRGVRFGLLRTACHGALACSHWWKHPAWPTLVERYVSVLDIPTDPHWGPDGEWHAKLGTEPDSMRDGTVLAAMLLKTPWKLDDSAAEWITNSGFRYTSPTSEAPTSTTSDQ